MFHLIKNSIRRHTRHLCACPACGSLTRIAATRVGRLTRCRICRSRFYAQTVNTEIDTVASRVPARTHNGGAR